MEITSNNKKILIIIFLVFLLGVLFFLKKIHRSELDTYSPEIKTIKINGIELKVDLAITEEEKTIGLSDRDSLNEHEGMLFVFDIAGNYSFWMKDMNFPIDIIWIGEDFTIVHIEREVLPESYPSSFSSNTLSKYVLETVAGFSEKNNLKIGDKIEFLP